MKANSSVVQLVSVLCEINRDFLTYVDASGRFRKIIQSSASNAEKTRRLFEPMMVHFSYQGTSDRVANTYREAHGDITYLQISRKLNKFRKEKGRLCSKLHGFGAFENCGYKKGRETCNNPRMLAGCPLPTHDLRTGILNQKAYSFYFFLRDICSGDLLAHIDNTIDSQLNIPEDSCSKAVKNAGDELTASLARIKGVGPKLASMTLADILMVDKKRPKWAAVGKSMIAVDTLVHNFLHRTGILRAFSWEHPYGDRACSEKCVSAIYQIAREIDARQFNEKHQKCFPRFVQHSIWAFCAEDGSNMCNGNSIDDSDSCSGDECPVSEFCDKIPLFT